MAADDASLSVPRSKYAALAQQHGLRRQVGRPWLGEYLRDLWRSRNFIWTLATTRAYSQNENTYLGQIWSFINPLLYAAVYYLIFGVVLNTTKGITNFVGFLVIGLFVFQFCTAALSQGSGAVVNNMSMIRSLRFPRAVLPISIVVTEFLTLLPTIIVMFVLVTLTGERPTWSWLLTAPMFMVITLFNVGVALVFARVVATSRDIKNLIPFMTQLLRYMSGIFFSIEKYAGDGLIGVAMMYQPYALSIEIIREALLVEYAVSWTNIAVMCAWAVGVSVCGLLYFWRGEGKYGFD